MFSLKNEFIMAPVKLGYSNQTGIVTQRHIDFYKLRSKHIGAITLEPLYMDAGLRELPTQLGIDSDKKLPGIKQLLETIHNNGAKVIAHINHPGRMANPKITGNYFWSSTDKACENGGAVPKQMNRLMMDKVISLHVEAVIRAEKAGFDIIELQMGHGYLLSQFLSPMVNNRTDKYGGSFKNRMRFPLEVLRAVKNAVNIPIMVRLSGDEIIPSGLHIDDAIQLATIIEKEGADAIHVSAGSACNTPPWFFQHMFIPKGKTWELAGKIKKHIHIPVVFVGRINSIKDINLLKEKYNAEYFALGRAMVADPDFVGKYLKKVEGLIRPCLACSEGCLGGVKNGKGLGCVVNPLVNTGLKPVNKTKLPKKYAVVGGGIAGMESAIVLKKRGHKVDLFEKNKLGGQFNLAYLPPHKESMKEIIDYYKTEIQLMNIPVHYTEATKDEIVLKGYDGVIMATGAIPAVPHIKGLKKYYWTDFLFDNYLPSKKKILIIGGGLIGLEVASKLIDNNNKVIIVEMLGEIARGMEMIEKILTIKKLKSKKVEIINNHKVIKIKENTVFLQGNTGEKVLKGINEIVIATGMRSYVPFEKNNLLPHVYFVGDAKKVGKAQEAIKSAYEIASQI